MQTKFMQAALDLLAARILRVEQLYADAEESVQDFLRSLHDASKTAGGSKSSPKSPADRPAAGDGGKGIASAVGGQIKAVLDLFSAKFLAVLTPIGIAAAALSAQSSGLGVFVTMLKFAGSVLGTVMLPVVAVMSAALYALAETISEALLPNLEAWATFIITNAMAAVSTLSLGFETLTTAAKTLYDAFQDVVNWVKSKLQTETGQKVVGVANQLNIVGAVSEYVSTKKREDARGADLDRQQEEINQRRAARAAGKLPPAAGQPNDFVGPPAAGQPNARQDIDRLFGEVNNRRAERANGGPLPAQQPVAVGAPAPAGGKQDADGTKPTAKPKKPGGLLGKFGAGLELFQQELAFQTGPKATRSSLVDVSKNAQQAALSVSPLDQRILQENQKANELAGKMVNIMQRIADKPGGLAP